MTMTLAIILGRGGSRGLPGKNVRPIAGRPCVGWTIDDAVRARSVDHVLLSTDAEEIAAAGRDAGITVIRRPPALATDTATVADAAAHALAGHEAASGVVADVTVILYANVPVRPPDLIDRAVATLGETGADSVQSYAPVGKHHPWWMVDVDTSTGRVRPFLGDRMNSGQHRRQDLPPAFLPDGGVIAVTRRALQREITGVPDGPHAFLGADHRAVLNDAGAVIDVDDAYDGAVAESILLARGPAEAAA